MFYKFFQFQSQPNLDVTLIKGDKLMDTQTKLELEAAAFRGLVSHLQRRTDVQNIDVMNLAGFCRNCLSKWYKSAAEKRDIEISYDEAREVVYGMPYEIWKENYQKEATEEQKNRFAETKSLHAQIISNNP